MAPSNTRLPVGNKDFTHATVVIIGAGISGRGPKASICVTSAKPLGSTLGGTWNDNKYPGCCCDVWSALYSFSFEQNPNWSKEYPGQEEIYAYLVNIAEKYGLYKHIRFNSTVEQAEWDETNAKWRTTVTVSAQKDSEFLNSYVIDSDFLVSAVGQLNLPHEPEIPRLHDFQGKLMHSARWDWSYDYKGKRIAIIGNGATAAQIVPEIAPEAAHLTVFQRTPNWLIPRKDAPVSTLQKALLKYFPPLLWRKRALQMQYRELIHSAVSDNESHFAKLFRTWCKEMMESQLVNKPELWEPLTPKYAVGCKRVIISDDYYPALARDNVDLETRRILRMTEKGIEVEGAGEQEYDLIILATGFKTVDFLHPITVIGRNGRRLHTDIWKKGATAYKGLQVEDLPNFGIFYGPNTNLGHNSIILMIEAQSRYLNAILKEILRARQSGKTLIITPTTKALKTFNDRIQAALQASSFADPNCQSWYKQDDGVITNNWSSTAIDYQRELSELRWEDYTIEGSGKDLLVSKKPTHVAQAREELVFSDSSLVLGLGVLAVVGGYFALRPGSTWFRSR
ncbi:hypothetical protein N7470_008955 [Penicillium chermesinum]|nr:hypothetical protein N7470_008955 [Penicillium chermesinum]